MRRSWDSAAHLEPEAQEANFWEATYFRALEISEVCWSDAKQALRLLGTLVSSKASKIDEEMEFRDDLSQAESRNRREVAVITALCWRRSDVV